VFQFLLIKFGILSGHQIMHVAITGANGFLGRYLGQYLNAHGKQSTGLLRRFETDFPYAHQVIGAQPDAATFEACFKGCDAVVHLAAQAHMKPGDSDTELKTLESSNVELVATVLRAAQRAGVRKFIFISSVKVYGETTGAHPFAHDSPQQPVDIYGESKRKAEQLVWAICRDSALKATIIQPPLIYGYGVKGNLQLLLKLMRMGIPLPFASIDNRRDVVALPVVCNLIDVCLDSTKADQQTFLVADGQARSTAQIIELLGQIHRVRAKLFACPAPVLRFLFRLPGLTSLGSRLLNDLQIDISHTIDQLNWQPRVPDPASLRVEFR
jgi:UDP-glucose 4-epimerase